ncbi:MAG: AAA family ATPase [Lachnospiraceae bacterium]|nr:AAA family ATPase [Lachnospiraceae bacterium]
MSKKLEKIFLNGFKAYNERQDINLSDINILMGANSSGKSSSIQSLLALKQTYESGQENIGLLLNGKYTMLGSFSDVVNANMSEDGHFSMGLVLSSGMDDEAKEKITIQWEFRKNEAMINQVELAGIKIGNGTLQVSIRLVGQYRYVVYVNDRELLQKVELDNLTASTVIMPYNVSYNQILAEFLKDTIQWVSKYDKNAIKIRKDRLVTEQLDGIRVMNIKGENLKQNSSVKEDRVKGALEVGEYILKMLRKQDGAINEDFAGNVVVQILLSGLEPKEFDDIWKKYEKWTDLESEEIEYTSIPLKKFLSTRRDEKSDECQGWHLIEQYNSILKEIVASIRYLGPMREMPKSLYQWDIDVDPYYVGVRGEHFPSVLATLKSKQIETILPGSNETESVIFSEALSRWCLYLQVANEVNVHSAQSSFGMSISIYNLQEKKSDIMNVGIGTSQILPVLILGLISPPDTVIVYEQPELHLHPYSQSRLADFFIAMSKLGKQIIIETHSEYMLHRFRYHLIKNTIVSDSIKVNFFANKEEGTFVYEGKLDQEGGIDYPEDFVDQNQSLFLEMLNAAKKIKDEGAW